MKGAPDTVTLRWCAICRRTDRHTPLKDYHFDRGTRCTGTVYTITYYAPWTREDWEQ